MKKSFSSKMAKVVASMLKTTLIVEANSNSTIITFQPKAPNELEKFRKSSHK